MFEKKAFLLSIGISMLAMFIVYKYIAGEDQKLQEAFGKSYTVVVAKRDILQYETIRPTDVEIINVPNAIVRETYGFIFNLEDVFESVAAIPISRGEFIIDNKIISKNIYSGLDTQISREKRALSIPVNVKSAVGFHLRPGNRVDLAAHFEYKSVGANSSEVKVFLQDLLVLASGRTLQTDPPKAVDQQVIATLKDSKDPEIPKEAKELRDNLNFGKIDSNFQTVTLEVTPQQAQTIVYVLTVFGDSMTLLLRHSDDRQLATTPTTNLYSIMGPDSYMAKGNRLPPPRTFPKIRYYDYLGEERQPVSER